jgi:hypothetical protein
MANHPTKAQNKPRRCVYEGPALKVPPGVRIRPKKFARFDAPIVPKRYWYLAAGLVCAALVVGFLVGRLLLD